MINTRQVGGRVLFAPTRTDENKEKEPGETQAFPDEIAHLKYIKGKLDEAIKQAHDSVGRIDKEYMDVKRYMVQYRAETDPHEMFQNELALKRIDNQGAFAVKIRDKLVKLLDSPYFARIDFQEASKGTPATFYIGRFAFSHYNELLISDWRSPVASMFYDCEVGPAGYHAPAGRINGELTRKRQFKIKNGELEYALESSLNIQDDILQRELCHTSNEKMKSIIATIQKEQNQVIRNEKAETIIIQGVAGSGKTSIALHRIAYLLYRFNNRLSAKNVAIVSPNKVFGEYISNVLPELGEEPVYGMSFADIAGIQLEGIIHFEPDKDPLETDDPKWAERVRFKSTLDFIKLMDEYLKTMKKKN
jgi:DNA helicase-2/ATP-dependent DNA helicase PcrA